MKKQTKVWKTKEGNKIRLCDMTDSHLLNCIALLERHANMVYNRAISACCSIHFQGEMAQDAQDNFLDSAEWEDYLPAIYDNFIEEKYRRELLNEKL